MARFSTHKAKKQQPPETDPAFTRHLTTLRLASSEEYLEWCARHGFSRRIDKHWRLRDKEADFVRQAQSRAALARKKKESRKPGQILERIFSGEIGATEVSQRPLQAICLALASPQLSHVAKLSFQSILRHVSERSDLVSAEPVVAAFGNHAGNNFIQGLFALAHFLHKRIRPLEDWKPQTHNPRRQFASLARHLFAEWPIPAFMDSAWFQGSEAQARGMQGWFLHLGTGQNLRDCELPIPYTKRMAHHFLQAPSDFTVSSALRWGQIRALGGSERLVRAVVATRLGGDLSNDEFWISVLQFLAANPMLDPAQVGPIIDYVHNQKFEQAVEVVEPNGIVRRIPLQPNFSMKGRTAVSLLRQVEAWHRALAKTDQPKIEWKPSGIPNFEYIEGTDPQSRKRWRIRELLCTQALIVEGRRLYHCVATYARSCARGACSIWSLELETNRGYEKVLTIEVRNSAKLICQARGKTNAMPTEKHLGILRRWAAQAGLSIAGHT